MKSITTKSGLFTIADITDPTFYPGKKIPPMYEREASEGTWFFWPTDWLSKTFGGIMSSILTGYPMNHSTGFASPEEALHAAEQWEIIYMNRKKQEEADRALRSW